MTPTPFGPRPPVITPAENQATPGVETTAQTTPPAGTDPGATPNAQPDVAQAPAIILDPQPAWETPAETPAEQSSGSWLDPGIFPRESKSLLGPMLLVFGVLLLTIVMLRHLRRKSLTRPVPQPVEDRIASIHERAVSTIGPVERTMSDAEELARRLSATMENKAARLELLIEESDRKLEELNRAIAQVSRATPASAERAGRPPRSIDPSVLDRARVEQDRAERNGHQSTPAARPAESAASPADPVHRRVWALADDGMPTLEIARSLNQPLGQVELILNLRKSG